MIQRLKALVLGIVLLLPALTAMPTSVSAVNVFPICGKDTADVRLCQSLPDPTKPLENPVIRILKVVITIISLVIGIASVIIIIISGLRIIASNGDSQAVARARSGIIYALVGIAIAVLAEIIVAFVLNKL